MKIAISAVLVVITILLAVILVGSIREPIAFKAEKEKREEAVVEKLKNIREAQELYRGITGQFAHDFDTLRQVLTNGKFRIIQVFGDPDDPTNTEAVRYDTSYVNAIDSVNAVGVILDGMEIVPFTGNDGKFEMAADTIEYQSTKVPVVQVQVKRKVFMGEYKDPKYAKYDSRYDPNSYIKFGDMTKPSLSGSWQ